MIKKEKKISNIKRLCTQHIRSLYAHTQITKTKQRKRKLSFATLCFHKEKPQMQRRSEERKWKNEEMTLQRTLKSEMRAKKALRICLMFSGMRKAKKRNKVAGIFSFSQIYSRWCVAIFLGSTSFVDTSSIFLYSPLLSLSILLFLLIFNPF